MPRMVGGEFDRAVLHAHLVGIGLAGQGAAAKPSPISTPLTALMPISAAAMSASSLA